MKKLRNWGNSVVLVTMLAVSTGDLSAIAQESESTSTPDSVELAQLTGQCRAAKRDIFIYAERSTTSTKVRAVPANGEVTLAGDGSNGWIAVSAPATGFVQAADLKSCGGTNPPPPVDLCRRAQVALNVRATPSETGNYVTTLAAGQRVTLRSTQERTVNGRSWVEITSPVQGWISSGVGTTRNIANCPTSDNGGNTGRTCRVTYAQGLRTWSSPTGNAIPPGVAAGQTITTTGQRQVIGNRVWLEISQPVRAWISSGFVGNENNIDCR